MKNFKRFTALLLAVLMLAVFAGCHGKDEVAATAGETSFTSAFYMCALINADMEARTKVDEAKAAEKKEDTTSSASSTTSTVEETDYFAEKIEDKTYSQWVKDTALATLKRFAYLEAKVKELKLEIDKEEIANYEYYAEYYWSSYGYQSLFEPNGVALATYKKYMAYSAYEDAYFDHLYGEGGEKEIAAADIKAYLKDNYVITNALQGSLADLKEAEATELKDKFSKYETRLKNGEAFKKVYNEYNNVKEEDNTSSTTSTTDEPKPLDELAQIIGKEGTSYASDYYETVKAMAVGEVKQYTPESDKNTLLLFKKGDIMADPYYLEEMDDTIRYDMKFKEFDKDVDAAAAKQELTTVAYAINRFKVEKIAYPAA